MLKGNNQLRDRLTRQSRFIHKLKKKTREKRIVFYRQTAVMLHFLSKNTLFSDLA